MRAQVFFYDDHDGNLDSSGPFNVLPELYASDEEGMLVSVNPDYKPGDTVQVFSRNLLHEGHAYVVIVTCREVVHHAL